MELQRKHFLVYGFLLVMLGIELRLVDTITLNEQVTKFIAAHSTPSVATGFAAIFPSPTMHQFIHPPMWLGWSLLCVGTVSLLHAFPMKG